MAKDEIRLRYSGFVIFVAKMLSVITGLVFQLMIARSVTTQDYGIWFNINDLLHYFTLPAAVLPFWAMRFAARKEEGAVKTGLIANFVIAIMATIVYMPLIPIMTSALGVDPKYTPLYFLSSAQIVEIHLINAFEACLRAKSPQALGYGLLIMETCKVALGYIFIIKFQRLLEGAIISLTMSMAVQTLFYLKLLWEEMKQNIKWAYVKEWLKGSLANIYNAVGDQIAAFIFIMLFTYGGETARSNYGAAAQIANIITYSSFLAFALYPKLLAEKSSQDITTSIKTVLMFAIPMAAGALAIPDSYLTILKGEYRGASPILMVLAVDALIATLSALFGYVLYGLERLDEKAKISLRELAKSRLLIGFSLTYIHSAITLPTTLYILTTYTQNQPVPSALAVAIINSTARFAMFLILYAIVRKMTEIKMPWKNIAKYLFASAVMAAVIYVIPHPTRIYATLSVTALGGIIYLTLLMAIDKEAKTLAHSVWQEIKIKLKGAA
ncbi:MAG: oligosaccharide flippase family protein [Candidatus Bathyarchaeia archaeon]